MVEDQSRGAVAPAKQRRVKFVRPRMEFKWEGAFEGYARNYIARNFWRVREILGSEEDAIQECAIVFLRCVKLYGDKVDNPAWMMSLFKQALAREWIDLAHKDSRRRALPTPEVTEGMDFHAGMLSVAIAEASAEVQQVIKLLANAPAEFIGMMFAGIEDVAPAGDAPNTKHQTINRRLKRLLGISHSATDILSELRALLS